MLHRFRSRACRATFCSSRFFATLNYVTEIDFGFGTVSSLAAHCEKYNITKPMIVTDKGLISTGLIKKTIEPKLKSFVIFDETPSNPTEASVMHAVKLFKKNHCDGLIAVGGGSPIDCAKGIAIGVKHPSPLSQYATIEGGSNKITADIVPIIAIPTTSGTGSEVARGAILILDDGRKVGFHSWHLVPKVAICDPDMTVNLPPMLTAATGMDAIAHCMETYMSSALNPVADGIALEGLHRGWRSIIPATRNGQNREARLDMMAAAMNGALAFQKGLGCVHSLSHALGGLNPKYHHGTLNAIFLPAVIRFNEAVLTREQLARMEIAMQLPIGAHVADAVKEMTVALGLPTGLRQLGVKETDFAYVIKHAMKDHSHKTNPRLATEDDYHRMLLESI